MVRYINFNTRNSTDLTEMVSKLCRKSGASRQRYEFEIKEYLNKQ